MRHVVFSTIRVASLVEIGLVLEITLDKGIYVVVVENTLEQIPRSLDLN